VLQRLGSRHVMVVYGLEGLDEISVSGETLVAELKDGEVREYRVNPAQFGLQASDLSAIRVTDGAQSREMVLAALDNRAGAARDIVALNAGAAIYVSGLAESHEQGVQKALTVISSGAARRKVQQLADFTQRFRN
jgi:anthranilate phosphoribosyltransferase